MDKDISLLKRRWKHWHYKNTAFLIISIIFFLTLSKHPAVLSSLNFIKDFGYFGALLSGIFFVYIYTVTPAAVVILHLATTLNPYLVALFSGIGAVIGDYIILRFLKDRIFVELAPLFVHGRLGFIIKLFRTPHFAWVLPIIGAVLVASPITDEVGISLMGMSKLKNWQFLLVTFVLNTLGIFALITGISAL